MTTEKKKKKLSRSAADAATVIPRAPLFSFLAFPRPFLDAIERGTMCSRASAWLLVEPRCRTVLAGTRFHSAPFSCAVALFFLLVLPCSFFLLFPSLSLFFCALFFNPFSPLTAESGDALVHERGEKRKRARPQREKKSAKEEKVASSFFFSFSTSLFSHPPSLPSAPQTTNQRQASPAEAVKDAVEAVKDAVEDVKDAVVHAVEEAVSADDKEPAEAEATPAVEVKVQTSPHDARFPATNQSRHCYTRYNEYYRCVAQKGEEDEECKFVSSWFLGFGISWGRERRRRRRRPEGGKNSPPFLFSLFYNNDNANNNSTSARTARSAPRSGSRSGRSSGRQASLFLYSPPLFFRSRRRRPALEKGCPTTRISLVLFSTSTAQQQQKTLPLNRCVRRQVLDG